MFFALFVAGYSYSSTIKLVKQRETEVQKAVIQTKENATKEVINDKVVIRHNELYGHYWIEDMNGKDLTNQVYYEVTNSIFDNKLLIWDENGYALFNIDTNKIGQYYEDIDDMMAYKKNNKKENVYVVKQNDQNWYVLSKDKFYKQPVIIGEGTTMEIMGKEKFLFCIVDLTDENQPEIKLISKVKEKGE